MRYILTLLLTFAIAGPAFAFSNKFIDSRDTPTEISLTGVVMPASGVEDFTSGADLTSLKQNVIMQGSLTKSGMNNANYLLTDSTGTIPVQIDAHIVGDYNFAAGNMVRIRGNMIRPLSGDVIVNVDTVELLR